MKFRKKHFLLLITLFIFFILAVGVTSATEVNNQTSTIIKSNQASAANDFYEEDIKDTSINQDNKTVKASSEYTYVNSKSNGTYNGTTKSQPTTLSKAIESAKDNQIICLSTDGKQDTYIFTEEIHLYSKDNLHNLTIMGESGKTIIFNGKFNIFKCHCHVIYIE